MGEIKHKGFFDKTIRKVRKGWRGMASSSYDAEAATRRPDLPPADAVKLQAQMRDCLEIRGGEVSSRERAAALGHIYLALDSGGRKRFLEVLLADFDVDHTAVLETAKQLAEAVSDDEQGKTEAKLRRLLESPRLKILRQFNALPDGIKFLVDMRAEILTLSRDTPELKPLANDIRDLMTSWFDINFLELKQISWDNASAALLEKLISYEAVHAIESWDDLKNRLDSDRRCFAYFHPRMPEEPLIFVEVALVRGMAANIHDLLDEQAPVIDPNEADTAIFYSISNAQQGLAGISFGNFLIKMAVSELSTEFPNLKTFSTLSPVPGFMKWLHDRISEGETGLLKPDERKAISTLSKSKGSKGTLKALLSNNDWASVRKVSDVLEGPLMRLCARYLMDEKRRPGRALDPVAHFHLSNGAIMERLNWQGDCSNKGLGQSAGIMINYLYDPEEIEDNHENYSAKGAVTASSDLLSIRKG